MIDDDILALGEDLGAFFRRSDRRRYHRRVGTCPMAARIETMSAG
jgi:hypothetical protein